MSGDDSARRPSNVALVVAWVVGVAGAVFFGGLAAWFSEESIFGGDDAGVAAILGVLAFVSLAVPIGMTVARYQRGAVTRPAVPSADTRFQRVELATAVVPPEGLALRSKPDMNRRSSKTAEGGLVVRVVRREGDWALVWAKGWGRDYWVEGRRLAEGQDP